MTKISLQPLLAGSFSVFFLLAWILPVVFVFVGTKNTIDQESASLALLSGTTIANTLERQFRHSAVSSASARNWSRIYGNPFRNNFTKRYYASRMIGEIAESGNWISNSRVRRFNDGSVLMVRFVDFDSTIFQVCKSDGIWNESLTLSQQKEETPYDCIVRGRYHISNQSIDINAGPILRNLPISYTNGTLPNIYNNAVIQQPDSVFIYFGCFYSPITSAFSPMLIMIAVGTLHPQNQDYPSYLYNQLMYSGTDSFTTIAMEEVLKQLVPQRSDFGAAAGGRGGGDSDDDDENNDPGLHARAFLLDPNQVAIASSTDQPMYREMPDGTNFSLFPPGHCTDPLPNQRRACFYEIESHPLFSLLKAAGAGRNSNNNNSDTVSGNDDINTAKIEDPVSGEEFFWAKSPVSYTPKVVFTLYIFIPSDFILGRVNSLFNLSLALVVVIVVIGAVATYFLLRPMANVVEELTMKLADDPFDDTTLLITDDEKEDKTSTWNLLATYFINNTFELSELRFSYLEFRRTIERLGSFMPAGHHHRHRHHRKRTSSRISTEGTITPMPEEAKESADQEKNQKHASATETDENPINETTNSRSKKTFGNSSSSVNKSVRFSLDIETKIISVPSDSGCFTATKKVTDGGASSSEDCDNSSDESTTIDEDCASSPSTPPSDDISSQEIDDDDDMHNVWETPASRRAKTGGKHHHKITTSPVKKMRKVPAAGKPSLVRYSSLNSIVESDSAKVTAEATPTATTPLSPAPAPASSPKTGKFLVACVRFNGTRKIYENIVAPSASSVLFESPALTPHTSSLPEAHQALIDDFGFIVGLMFDDVITPTGAHLIEYRNEFFIVALRLSKKNMKSKLASRFVRALIKVSHDVKDVAEKRFASDVGEDAFSKMIRDTNSLFTVGIAVSEALVFRMKSSDDDSTSSSFENNIVRGPRIDAADNNDVVDEDHAVKTNLHPVVMMETSSPSPATPNSSSSSSSLPLRPITYLGNAVAEAFEAEYTIRKHLYCEVEKLKQKAITIRNKQKPVRERLLRLPHAICLKCNLTFETTMMECCLLPEYLSSRRRAFKSAFSSSSTSQASQKNALSSSTTTGAVPLKERYLRIYSAERIRRNEAGFEVACSEDDAALQLAQRAVMMLKKDEQQLPRSHQHQTSIDGQDKNKPQ